MSNITQPWSPGTATSEIRRRAQADGLNLSWTKHVKEQMAARDLTMGDIRHVLKFGFVLNEAKPATTAGYYRYRMEGTTPNSGGRTVAIVVIPSITNGDLKLVTAMWKDE